MNKTRCRGWSGSALCIPKWHLAAGLPAQSLGGQSEDRAPYLRGLLDELEEIFPPDVQASHPEAER